MKIKKIEKICKATGQIVTVEANEELFIGSAKALYLASRRYSGFRTDDFLDFFGIYGKEADKFFCDELVSEDFIYMDSFRGEKEVFDTGIEIDIFGTLLKIFRAKDANIYFVPSVYLSGYKNDKDELYFTVRENWLAVKRGMYLDGIIQIMDENNYPKVYEECKKYLEEIFGKFKEVKNGEQTCLDG